MIEKARWSEITNISCETALFACLEKSNFTIDFDCQSFKCDFQNRRAAPISVGKRSQTEIFVGFPARKVQKQIRIQKGRLSTHNLSQQKH